MIWGVKHYCRTHRDIYCAVSAIVMQKTEWIRCPVCTNKTRVKMRDDTVLENFPLYCPKCGKETLIRAKNRIIEVINEPDAIDAEPMTQE